MKNIDEKQLRLLMLLLVAVIIFGSYRFGYVVLQEKTEEVQTEMEELNTNYLMLSSKVHREDELNKENEENVKARDELLKQYGAGLTQEKTILYFSSLEKATKTKITNIAFNAYEKIMESTSIPSQGGTVIGVSQLVSTSYEASDEAFAKAIQYILDSTERIVIDSIDIQRDATTNQLRGTLALRQFAIYGTDKVYEAPLVGNVPTGNDKLFGID